jgi:hypothetical protein
MTFCFSPFIFLTYGKRCRIFSESQLVIQMYDVILMLGPWSHLPNPRSWLEIAGPALTHQHATPPLSL